MPMSRWFQKVQAWIFGLLFGRQGQTLKSRLEQWEADIDRLEGDVARLEQWKQGQDRAAKQMRVGAKVPAHAGSWVVVCYTLGDREYVNFYDFGAGNTGALREFLEKFVKAGIAVRLASPFERPPKGRN